MKRLRATSLKGAMILPAIAGVVMALTGVQPVGHASASAPMEARSVEDLAWLAGCWASTGGEEGSGEQWMAPAGGTMLGVSRTVRDSNTVAYEYMQIRNTAEQNVEFIAKPSGQSEAAFIAVELTDGEVVFQNPGHDFPQRIIYALKADGALEVRIEGEMDGDVRRVTFPFTRIACGVTP